MTLPRVVPIFDGHNDVPLRLYRRGGTDAPRAFLEGGADGHLYLPKALQGGFAGGLFAVFVPSSEAPKNRGGDAKSKKTRMSISMSELFARAQLSPSPSNTVEAS
ncbi:MAG: membrane dipeptidase [Xanthobacteraceae bacterium]